MKELDNLQFDSNGLIPAIIQDAQTRRNLMLGYMNAAAIQKTLKERKVTFFSRSKNRIWTKGETSGNFLNLVEISMDCDKDTLLLQVIPEGPTCHKGTDTCWGGENTSGISFLNELDSLIEQRIQTSDEGSYISSLLAKGINKVAQKVGEEAVEVVIEAKDQNEDLFLNESADLLFHLMVLLRAKGNRLEEVVGILEGRNRKEKS